MKLDITHMLTKSTSPFYGIVPGNAAIPLGSVVLLVTFGETRENYRTEYIKFEVADFETSYHTILGRPAIAKFVAVPHYTYLVLKMPSPTGVLLRQVNSTSQRSRTTPTSLSQLRRFKSRQLTLGQATTTRLPPLGRASTRNRKTRSSASFGLTETSSRGNQRTCQGCPRI
jgi:hypothetical protein